MLLPGFSIARVPVIIRLFLAFVTSLTIQPLLRITLDAALSENQLAAYVASEMFVGFFFGFLCALFIYAVRFFAHFVMALIGLAGIPGQSVEDVEPNPAFVMILSMSFTALIFALDLHLQGLGAILETYKVYPIGEVPDLQLISLTLSTTLRDTSMMALQASSPFVLYCVGVNFALGLVGKLTPQLQGYFALMGASIIVAFIGLYVVGSPLLSFMVGNYAGWLETGF
jgi:flagellar biosynthesis protein FliR